MSPEVEQRLEAAAFLLADCKAGAIDPHTAVRGAIDLLVWAACWLGPPAADEAA